MLILRNHPKNPKTPPSPFSPTKTAIKETVLDMCLCIQTFNCMQTKKRHLVSISALLSML